MLPSSVNGYDFNLDAMTSFEGDTGPYLQYAHARLCSMARKSELNVDELVNANFDLLTEKHAVDLVRLLAQWPDVLLQTAKTLEPITVLSYLFRMTHMLSSSYDVLKVIGSEPDVKQARMALYASARQVLNNGMRVLGLNPVERLVSPFPIKETITKLLLVCKCDTTHLLFMFEHPPYMVYLDFILAALGAKSGTNKNGSDSSSLEFFSLLSFRHINLNFSIFQFVRKSHERFCANRWSSHHIPRFGGFQGVHMWSRGLINTIG